MMCPKISLGVESKGMSGVVDGILSLFSCFLHLCLTSVFALSLSAAIEGGWRAGLIVPALASRSALVFLMEPWCPGICENYAVVPLFFLYFSLFIARPPVLSTTLNCIIMPHDYYDNTWHVLMVKISCIGYNS